ncbi:MAG: aquaporin family protein [Ignavibacteria bacterium]|nr:aquaporin family protein [Ignavibacteria bacterium]
MKRFIAEFTGTFFLVFVGTGVIAMQHIVPFVNPMLASGIAFGGAVALMILAFGKTSGAHINPAVTLGFLTAGQINRNRAFMYIVSQILGAILASFTLMAVTSADADLGTTNPTGGIALSILIEFTFTFLLMYTILYLQQSKTFALWSVAVTIGALIAVEAYVGGPISGASMNPARSIGPAVASGNISHLWIYVASPTLGALTAVMLCCRTHGRQCCEACMSEIIS